MRGGDAGSARPHSRGAELQLTETSDRREEQTIRIRRPARRRGGARVVTLGVLVIGGSSFVLLAEGPRLLGGGAFSGLALIWTVSTVFGIGIAAPTEQVIGRRMNIGAHHGRGPVYALWGAGTLAAVSCAVVGPRLAASAASPHLVPGMVLAIAGWVAVATVRGRLAGAGDLGAYSAVLVVEGLLRTVLVAAAVARPGFADVLLPAAVGLPLLLAAVAGWSLTTDLSRPAGPDAVPAVPSEQLNFVLVAVGYQVCLNGAPLLLEWRFGQAQPTLVGAFVAASTYFRSAALVAGGVVTYSLVELSNAWGLGDLTRFRHARAASMKQGLLIVLSVSAVLGLAAPFALSLYYGSSIDLAPVVLVALGASTVVAVTANIAVQPLLAAGRGRPAAGLVVSGAVLTCLVLTISSGVDTLAAVGLVLGPAATLAGALVMDSRLQKSMTGGPSAVPSLG